MKAILVIDIDANELPKDAYANVYVFGKYGEQEDDFVACIGDVPLKPMPDIKTKEAIKLANMINPKATFQEFADGWNDCLEEIEK